jgi:hypothetical protein
MAENSTNEIEEQATEPKAAKKKAVISYRWFFDNLMFLVLLFVIALAYIRNAHYNESLVRQIDETKAKTKVMRWEYMTVKAALMQQSKQTEVAKAVKSLELKELTTPPKKITIKAGEY